MLIHRCDAIVEIVFGDSLTHDLFSVIGKVIGSECLMTSSRFSSENKVAALLCRWTTIGD